MLMEQLDYNLLFRWFVGLTMDDAVWAPTTFTKNRDRLPHPSWCEWSATDDLRSFMAKTASPLLETRRVHSFLVECRDGLLDSGVDPLDGASPQDEKTKLELRNQRLRKNTSQIGISRLESSPGSLG